MISNIIYIAPIAYIPCNPSLLNNNKNPSLPKIPVRPKPPMPPILLNPPTPPIASFIMVKLIIKNISPLFLKENINFF